MLRNLFLLTLCLGCAIVLRAQQDEQFTQYMYNKQGLNPAYVGVPETGTFTMLARQQWMGLDGAPQSQLISFNTPISSSGIGLGGMISRHSIGLTDRFSLQADYAYRFNLGRGGRLGIGLSSSVRLMRINFDDARPVEDPNRDESIPVGIQSKYVPNFGAGIYYSNPDFYIGVSAPRLLQNNIDLADEQLVISREVRHFYVMGGILFRLSDKLKLHPQALLKMVKGAPFDADANLNFIFRDKFYAGLSYRLGGSSVTGYGESASALLGLDISEHLQFGLSYDLTLSDLRSHQSGSLEGVLLYRIGGRSEGATILNPRRF